MIMGALNAFHFQEGLATLILHNDTIIKYKNTMFSPFSLPSLISYWDICIYGPHFSTTVLKKQQGLVFMKSHKVVEKAIVFAINCIRLQLGLILYLFLHHGPIKAHFFCYIDNRDI